MRKLVDLLKVLADEKRFRIVNLLLKHNFCVRPLAKKLGISEAAVSQHLKILREAGFVKGEKKGYWTHYSAVRDIIIQMADELRNLVNQESDCGHICQSARKECFKEGVDKDE